ncbi:hypothetical protein LCL95_00225 [Bacillus timonensis]|nr:hypothetical protein [Bacillus timonensis]
MKVYKAILNVCMITFILLLLVMFGSIGKLIFTDSKIAKLPFTDYYLAKIESGEHDFDVFKNHMRTEGWNEVSQFGGLHTFEKDGETMEILNTQVKTIIIDGSINLK